MKRWSLDARSKGQPGYALPYWLIVVHEVEGVESDGHLCSRNARPRKDGKDSLVVLLLAERARSECARSTRAIEDRPGRTTSGP